MNKDFIKYLKNVLLASAPFLCLILSYFLSDPFKVLYKYEVFYPFEQPYIPLNRDYVSTESFITNDPKYHYDSFVFGNSSSIFFEVKDWQSFINYRNCFHFDASAESLFGIATKLRFLDENHAKINNALIVIGPQALGETENTKGHLVIKDPSISKESWLQFHFEFLKVFLNNDFFLRYFAFKIFPKNLSYSGFILDLRLIAYNQKLNEIRFSSTENIIKNDKDSYYSSRMSKFFYRVDSKKKSYQPFIHDKQLQLLREIAGILKRHNTSFRIVISPHYDQIMVNSIDLDCLYSIFGRNNVFNFSGVNCITSNFYNYYDNGHFRPHIAKIIMKKIYLNDEKTSSTDAFSNENH
jgi:hypothetical protein